MPFHHLLPPPHIAGLVLSSALAFAAGAYIVSRHRLPAGIADAQSKLRSRFSAWRGSGDGLKSGISAVFSRGSSGRAAWNSTGNSAFEHYRSATLTELEQEAADFRKYLNELRHAKDKSEFDAFLNERRRTLTTETSSP
jgi:hypothetical protein